MPRPALFVDTWGWLALEDRADPGHAHAAESYRGFRADGGQALTTDFVLDETVTLLFRRRPFAEAREYLQGVLASAVTGHLQIQRITAERFTRAWTLRLRYQDKPSISFTDLTSFVVMQDMGISQVLTDDDHFAQVNLGFTRLPA
jgi:predicted nucleic acid-binding protein